MKPGAALRISLYGFAWLAAGGCAGPSPPTPSERPAHDPDSQVAIEALGDSEVLMPGVGETTELELALRLTNLGSMPIRFRLLDTVSILVRDPEGRVHRLEGGRDGTRAAPELSPPVAPGRSLVIDRPARLRRTAEELRLEVEDEFGSRWLLTGLVAGTHGVSFVYENQPSSDEVEGVWIGTATSPEKEVLIR